MKVSELIIELTKVKSDLDVFLVADAPKSKDVDGVIEPVDAVRIVSVKDADSWKPLRVELSAENKDEE